LNHPTTGGPRKGIVLVSVLLVLVLLTLAAYQYSELMSAEYTAVGSYTRLLQARAVADSGIHYTAALLSDPELLDTELGYNPYDNEQYFRDIPVGSDAEQNRGTFSIITLRNPDELEQGGTGHRFGVSDESGKINLNILLALDGGAGNVAQQILLKLPNMSEDVANAILDWLDPDETPRANGAENETYTALLTPYRCKNGPLDSIEELLLVQGVTPALLFGNDRNRNGVLDPDEDDTGLIDLGWSAYLTIYSRERNTDSMGNARIYLNDQDTATLESTLGEFLPPELILYMKAYRMYGGSSIDSSSTPEAPDMEVVKAQMDRDQRDRRRRRRMRSLSSVYDLVNTQVKISVQEGNRTREVIFPSPLSDSDMIREYLPILLDQCTTTRNTDLPPRINVNTAPQAVLAALPGLTEAEVQSIYDRRPDYTGSTPPDPIYLTPAWLITEANIPAQKLRGLDRFITANSQVYRFQVLGYFQTTGLTSRLEAVIDTNYGRPRIVYWRDLQGLGKGFNLNLERAE
jgi:DNA uptake protein ComE-like DNA-binding protein